MLIFFDSTTISIYSFLSINAWSSNNAIFDKKYTQTLTLEATFFLIVKFVQCNVVLFKLDLVLTIDEIYHVMSDALKIVPTSLIVYYCGWYDF